MGHHMYGGNQWTSVELVSDIKLKVMYKFYTTLVWHISFYCTLKLWMKEWLSCIVSIELQWNNA